MDQRDKFTDKVLSDLETQLSALKESVSEKKIQDLKSVLASLKKQVLNKFCFSDDAPIIHFFNMMDSICDNCLQIHNCPECDKRMQELIYLMEEMNREVPVCMNKSVGRDAYRLSIAAIIRNEEYIIEWIEYHRLVGVEHFYIYDNESTDGLKDKLQGYIENGIVTYTFFPGDCVQNKAYQDAVDKYKNDTKWLAIIDGDEYIVPVEGTLLPDLCDEIESINDYRGPGRLHVGGIGINGRVYGTSFHKKKVGGLCIENYTYRCADNDPISALIKTIVNPRVITVALTNNSKMKKGYYSISENGTPFVSNFFYESTCKKIRINHYHSKSEEELISKLHRGWPDQEHVELGEKRIRKEIEKDSKLYNATEDFIMKRYVDDVKKRVEEYEGICYEGVLFKKHHL